MDCSQTKLSEYSTDNSPYTIRPQAIVYPKNATDIKHVLSFAREYTMPVTVRGNGSGSEGGALGEGIIIDMTRYFTNIRQINMFEHTITVDAGVTIQELREKLTNWHMEIPILTAADNSSTVGAFISTKSVTPTSFHFGTARDWIEALTVVVDTGEEHRIADGITPSGRLLGIYQAIFPILISGGPTLRAAKPETSDDATGYCVWNTSIGPRQLLDQIVGGEGTLGIITTVTMRLNPIKKFTTTVCIPLLEKTTISLCAEISKRHAAEHIFLYDSTFMELVDRYHLYTTPAFPDAAYALCVSFSGNSREDVSLTVKNFTKALPVAENLLIHYEDKSFIERITSQAFLLSLFDSYTQGSHVPISVCDGIIVPHSQFTSTLETLENYLYSTGRLYVITGNVGSGHISIITLFDPLSPSFEQDVDIYTQTIFTCIKKNKGGISAKGGDGIARAPYVPFFYNEATVAIFNDIKKAWDPLLILNPGKKIGTSLNYLHNHFTRKDSR